MVGRLVKLAVAAAVVAIALGLYFGSGLPYGTKRLKTAEGTAEVLGKGGVAAFDEEDGDLNSAFSIDHVSWSDGSEVGDGNPPCLRHAGQKAHVKVGYLDVQMPDGRKVDGVIVYVDCDG